MKRNSIFRPSAALLLTSAMLASGLACADPKADISDAVGRYQQERTACLTGQSSEDQATCLREAGAALAQARHGGLDDGAMPYRRNALQRCEPLPDDDRLACQARMLGMGTTTGSVAGGGILRELVVREIIWPDNAQSESATP
jgi:hypothetical protein